MFSSPVDLWDQEENLFGSVGDTIMKDTPKPAEVADQLWKEDGEICSVKETTAYLGKLHPFHHQVLKLYMDYFDFKSMRLDDAFRKLCAKLYLKAEAQQIDRLLEVFAHRYYINNQPDFIYGHPDVVYAVVYSIMLLNTDLHLVQINSHNKMTCRSFCDNAMSVIMEQRIHRPFTIEWNQQIRNHLKDIYFSVKQKGILQPNEENGPSFLKRVGSLTQRRKKRSIKQTRPTKKNDYRFQDSMSYHHLYKQKHIPIEWKECRISLEKEYITLSRMQDNKEISIPIFHSVSGVYRDNEDVFYIQSYSSQHDFYLLKCESREMMNKWIQYCNYWAARESKMRLMTGVESNVRYGWELDKENVPIQVWHPPLLPAIHSQASKIEEKDQRMIIQHYLSHLQREYEEHMKYRSDMDRTVDIAVKNWYKKKGYLIEEITKLSCYDNAMIKKQIEERELYQLNEEIIEEEKIGFAEEIRTELKW
ncbi:Sec7 domain-containing protein [Pilobolus umbonatus]|nr:Sec7 domain-containing protein [Pilobolus umbonatus]